MAKVLASALDHLFDLLPSLLLLALASQPFLIAAAYRA